METTAEPRIWRVPEMLEAILYELPMKDLLLDQRVCKAWKASVDSSTKLKKKLFLIPKGEICNSIGGEQYQATNSTASANYTGADLIIKPNEAGDIRPILNPLLSSTLKDFDFEGIDYHGKVAVDGFDICGEGNWKRVLLSQPPIKRSTAYIFWTDGGPLRTKILKNEMGLTMGDVTHAFHRETFRVGPEWWEMYDRCCVKLLDFEDQYDPDDDY